MGKYRYFENFGKHRELSFEFINLLSFTFSIHFISANALSKNVICIFLCAIFKNFE